MPDMTLKVKKDAMDYGIVLFNDFKRYVTLLLLYRCLISSQLNIFSLLF